MKHRSTSHEAGSVEAGSSISKSIFFANRVVGAVVGAFACTKITASSAQGSDMEPARAHTNVQGTRSPARCWAPKASIGIHIEVTNALLCALGERW